MTPEDFLLNGDCDDCDRDPTECINSDRCRQYQQYLTCSNCGSCTFVESEGNVYCIECRQWQKKV